MIWETVRLALRAIVRNALRSFLTVLGIVIGVAAVIAMVTVGGGTTVQVTNDIAKLGSNILFVRPGQGFGPGGARTTAASFDARDLAAMRQQIRGVKAIAPISRAAASAIYGNENWSTTITGSTNEIFCYPGLGLCKWAPIFRCRNKIRKGGLRDRRHHTQAAVRKS